MIFKAARLNEIAHVKCVRTREEAPTLRPTFGGWGNEEKPAEKSTE